MSEIISDCFGGDPIGDLSGADFIDGRRGPMTLGASSEVKTVAAVGALGVVAITLVGGVGALVGMGVAAAVSGNKDPQYLKGAAIGAGAGIVGAMIL